MRYTLRSKNNGKRWGVWDREKKRWYYKPRFYGEKDGGKTGQPLLPLDARASKIADLLPQVIEARELIKKEKSRELALSKKKKKTKWISKKH